MTERILIIEDDEETRVWVRFILADQGYETAEAEHMPQAKTILQSESVMAIIVDINLLRKDRYELLQRHSRKQNGLIPVLTLVKAEDIMLADEAMEEGGDEFLIKPFESKELVLRLKWLLQRQTGADKNEHGEWTIHGLSFYPAYYELRYENHLIVLTQKQFMLFYRMAKNAGRVYSREELLELEWDDPGEGDSRTIDSHVKNIRDKLKESGYHEKVIETVWGVGYRVLP
ncbi:response regulator transcription factor [Salisediminibacterium halotolerans]|uniref:Heme response regulator HssR n=1 Tax=Salisediminibacterium halotolerans TaxID=517425 RepID=A0A1H9TTF9_9BACI|nr:response regulator transcription factor [Salisediminibacterium haloalkalitolerans]SES00515.1 two-component system, OmpR family, response regulator ResD [Salisediminibacterium haloalkalitolerans]